MHDESAVLKTSRGPLLGLALSLFIPSTFVFQKYLGIVGVVVYVAAASSALVVAARRRSVIERFLARLTDRQIIGLALLTFVLIGIAFLIVYPIANSGVIGGGSDNDEALNVATTELLHGRYPYSPRTYLGNPISPLPGALLLAAPFVLLGNSAYQNIWWLLVFFAALKWYLRGWRPALWLLWNILILSPIVLYLIMIGSDYIANTLYVLVFIQWLMASVSQSAPGRRASMLPAILLGIGLSSRANFLLVLPLVVLALARNVGWRTAIGLTLLTIAAFAAVTLPFYLYDPRGFTPLHTIDELEPLQAVLPAANWLIPAATGLLALVLAIVQPRRGRLAILFRNCAIVLALPVWCGIVLTSIRFAQPYFGYASFGVFYLFFGAAAFGGASLVETPDEYPRRAGIPSKNPIE
jgi:hypothetical protein